MRPGIIFITLMASILALSGCATSVVMPEHHLYTNPGDAYAQVVFFRPMPRRTRGVTDNDVTVDVDKQTMLKLSAGEYAVIRVKPIEAEVRLRNMTYLTYKVMPEEVSRARKFSFQAGETYFIRAELKVEEYRGYYFVPRQMEEAPARDILKRLKPVNLPLS